MAFNGAVIRTGWLHKEGVTRKSWKRRWFVLRSGDGIYYYSKQKDGDDPKNGKELGYVSIREIIQITENTSFMEKQRPPHCLHVITPRRTYYFVADSHGEMFSWKEALIFAVQQIRGPPKSSAGTSGTGHTQLQSSISTSVMSPSLTTAQYGVSSSAPATHQQAGASILSRSTGAVPQPHHHQSAVPNSYHAQYQQKPASSQKQLQQQQQQQFPAFQQQQQSPYQALASSTPVLKHSTSQPLLHNPSHGSGGAGEVYSRQQSPSTPSAYQPQHQQQQQQSYSQPSSSPLYREQAAVYTNPSPTPSPTSVSPLSRSQGYQQQQQQQQLAYSAGSNSPGSYGNSSALSQASSSPPKSLQSSPSNAYWSRYLQEEAVKVTVDDFEILAVVGVGSYGTVAQVRHKKTGNIFALKALNKKDIVQRSEESHTKAEKIILASVNHPFLMNLHYSFQTPDKLYFVMDFVNGGEMFYHLQREQNFDLGRTRFYAAEIFLGIEYLHSRGIIYRDLKPENLLLDAEGHIRITDFGLSKIGLWNRDDRTTTFCGTPQYVAPEVIEGKDYTKSVDWWSFGNVIYEMLVGLPPFYDQNEQKMYQLILRGRLDIPHEMNPDAADLIRRLLDRNPQTRLQDPDQIRSHPFFRGINWNDLLAKRVKPPYKPPVSSNSSVAMIDQEFLRMNITDILSTGENSGIKFDQFTYVSPHAAK